MAANPVPTSTLDITVEKISNQATVHCVGKIISETKESLKTVVKPLLVGGTTVVLDLTDVSYMDSSGLGTVVGLYVSAKNAKCELRLVNLNQRLKELFSITRLGDLMAQGRDPNYLGMP